MSKRHLENWIDGYLEYTRKQEAPEKFHFWTALILISAALKRQVWLDRGYYKLYPNLYVLMVAESAQDRKSIAMDLGVALIRKAVPDLYYISGSMTPEGLVKHMNRVKLISNENKRVIQYDSHVFIHADELAETFGYDRTRASKFTILLTKIYGSPREHMHTLASEGQLLLRNLYPTFLGGTDPRNLKVLPEEAVAGLIGRLIFVTPSERREPIAWGAPDDEDKKLYKQLGEDLYDISQLRGEVKPTAEAKAVFEQWYVKHRKEKHEDSRVDAFYGRCHDTAIKVAILLSIASSDNLVVELGHMTRGIYTIEQQIPEFSRVVDWASSSVYAQSRAKFVDLLRRQGGVGTRRQALKALAIPLEEVSVLENSLEQEGTIEILIRRKEVIYKLSMKELQR